MELFKERQSTPHQTSQETKLCTLGDAESIKYSSTEFQCNIDMKVVPKWFTCYEDLFIVDFKEQANDQKVRLLLRKLSSAERNKYSNYILPNQPRDYNSAVTVEILKQIFGKSTSLFNRF